jgi:predicted transcriptional regulator
MSMRDNTQADFDLEKMFEMLDEALTSRDERVQNALRGLLTIIALTRPQDDGSMAVETSHGPLRQMQEDLRNISRRIHNLESEMRQRNTYVPPQPYMPGPYNPGYPNTGAPPSIPNNPPGAWWGVNPNGPYTTSKASSSSSYTLTDNAKDVTIDIALEDNIKLTK